MKDKLLEEFEKKVVKKLNIPNYSIGRISSKKDGTTKFFEILVTRPERYSYEFQKKLKSIPKTYKGAKVKVF